MKKKRDIVERLRNDVTWADRDEAAAEIERLRAELAMQQAVDAMIRETPELADGIEIALCDRQAAELATLRARVEEAERLITEARAIMLVVSEGAYLRWRDEVDIPALTQRVQQFHSDAARLVASTPDTGSET